MLETWKSNEQRLAEIAQAQAQEQAMKVIQEQYAMEQQRKQLEEQRRQEEEKKRQLALKNAQKAVGCHTLVF